MSFLFLRQFRTSHMKASNSSAMIKCASMVCTAWRASMVPAMVAPRVVANSPGSVR